MGNPSDEADQEDVEGDALHSEMIMNRDQRAAVGCVAMESARFEFEIETVIWYLLGVKDRAHGLAVTEKMQFAHKLTLVQNLIEVRGKTKEFARMLQQITSANSDRRMIIHGVWDFPEGANFRDVIRSMADPERTDRLEARAQFTAKKGQPFRASDVMKVAKKYSQLQVDLRVFVYEHLPLR